MSGGRQRLLLVFLDGVGLGAPGSPDNPFALARTPFLEGLLGDRLSTALPARSDAQLHFAQLDARLGVPGLPQSATGQASILTGVNAAAFMGKHYGPWPGPTLRRLVERGNVLSTARAAGLRVRLANLYPPGYFRALEGGSLRLGTMVYAARHAGVRLRDFQSYQDGQAVSVDLDGSYLGTVIPGIRPTSPLESGRDARRLAATADLTLFDYWPSDQTGHRGTLEDAVTLVERIDEFLSGATAGAAEDGVTVLVTSDHGNLEDKSVRTHTLAPVPLLATGPGAAAFGGVTDLTGIAGAILRLLGLPPVVATPGEVAGRVRTEPGTARERDSGEAYEDRGLEPGADQEQEQGER